jgi:ribosomal protein S18 acetylase RimI-like enzyme
MREKAVGYITCDIENNRRIGRISLVGVDESAARMGIGSSLVYSALNWFYKEKIPKVIVITQGRNYDAQRLYQKCGFKTISVQLWYHKWFKNFGGD